ncbi:SRPBCC family protein [Actinoplanes sp. URMC 104]|uniref:SRPBCC family protein n=1 Tax=Actinoplanes sp. URMC 104 TaxID=3423409 RepID=UPI003F1AA914
MSINRLSGTARLSAPPAKVYQHLLDPHSYVGLSPLVVAVRDVRSARDEQGREATAYVAVERFPMGPLHWDNPIRVTLTGVVEDRRLVSSVVSPGAVRLTATVDLEPAPGGTVLTESIVVRSPRLLRSFVVGQAASVQTERMAELARRFSG